MSAAVNTLVLIRLMGGIMKRTVMIIGVLALCGSFATPASAGNTGWHLRVVAAGFDANLDESFPNDDGDEIQVTTGTDLGFGASLEYQFSSRWGVEFGVMTGSPTVELGVDVEDYGRLSLSDAMSTTVYTVDVDLRLTPSSRVFNLYIGAGMAWISYDDLLFEVPEVGERLGIRVDNDTAFTAKVGLDIALGESAWSATAALRYTDSQLVGSNADEPSSGSESFDFGLFNFTVGIGFNF
jgi:opacity protein-like surface antigen